MMYFDFLLRFLVIPIVILGVLIYRDSRQGRAQPINLRLLSPWLVIAVLVVVAVIYTTPWDNYLVATRVWWYDPTLVIGIAIGWVPLEEYTFFVLQTVMVGLWLLWLTHRLRAGSSFIARKGVRVLATAFVGTVWVASIILLFSGWKPGNYLALELVWALPPIALQLAVGADILWHYRRLVIPTIVSVTLYLCVMDAFAIRSGTWTINPQLSTGMLLAGVLPIEEAIFFLLTNTLLVFGLVLGLAEESIYRLPSQLRSALMYRNQQPAKDMTSANS